MENINKIMPEIILFNQDYINAINDLALKNAKTKEDKAFCTNKINGGKCIFCGVEWKLEEKKTKISNYSEFYPQCNCYKEIKIKKEKNEMQKTICLWSGIPLRYLNKEIENLNISDIQIETKEAIEKMKKYIDYKLYEKNLGVIFYGDIGVGKTLFAILIFKHLILNENKKGKFIRMSDILDNIIKSDFIFIEALNKYDVILLDDLDKLRAIKNSVKSGWAFERIFSLFDTLINNRKIVIATTNCQKISELNDLFDSAIISRLIGNCDIIKVKGNDYRIIERNALIKQGKNNE